MGRLTRVELRRYLAREGVRWLVVGMVAAVLVTGFAAWRSSRPPTQAQLDQAQQQIAMFQEQVKANADQQAQAVAQCKADQERQRQDGNATADFGCDQMQAQVPTVEQMLPRQNFAASAKGWLGDVATFVLLLSLILGATFVAAEFSTGSISTWLTFEPRRGQVFASKALVVTLVTGAVALAVSMLAVGLSWAATAINHSTGHTTGRTFTDLGAQSGRIAVAAAGAALLGAALAFLTRHTAAVIAVAIGWLVAIDGILVQALLSAPRWTVTYNLQAWLGAGTSYYQPGPCSPDPLSHGVVCNNVMRALSMTSGGLTLALLAAVVTGLGLLVFRRRDVA